MSLYGVELSGDPTARGVVVSSAYAITAPKAVPAASNLVAMLKGSK
jgi:hypothetical protein